MKSYNLKYSDYENLKEFIKANDIDKNSNILVQVFSGIITNIKSLMHQCKIVEELNELNLKLEEKVQEKTIELNIQYYKDSLTDLYNRNKLISDLGDKKYNKLAILDICSFNGINDFYGNELGDLILIGLSKLIKS